MNEWISVEERLPEDLTEVIAFVPKYKKWHFAYLEDGRWFDDDNDNQLGYSQKDVDGFIDRAEGVTHWMPLPEPPK